MNRCPNCGAYIPEGGKICIACGYKPENENPFSGMFSEENPYINYLQQVMDAIKEDDSLRIKDDNRWTAALSYLGPAFIYTYLKNKTDEFICFHANQACVLFAAYLVAELFDKLPVIGGVIKSAARWGIASLSFMGAKNAVANKQEAVPVLGELGIRILR